MEKKETRPEIDVVIPVYRPGEELRTLLLRLLRQTVKPAQILLVNTEQELFDERLVQGLGPVRVVHISKKEFDHGGTRRMAASMLDGDYLLFMTQDALPADRDLIRSLLAPFPTIPMTSYRFVSS